MLLVAHCRVAVQASEWNTATHKRISKRCLTSYCDEEMTPQRRSLRSRTISPSWCRRILRVYVYYIQFDVICLRVDRIRTAGRTRLLSVMHLLDSAICTRVLVRWFQLHLRL